VAEPAETSGFSARRRPSPIPWGRTSTTPRSFRNLDLQGSEEKISTAPYDGQAKTGGRRNFRPFTGGLFHSHGVARCGAHTASATARRAARRRPNSASRPSTLWPDQCEPRQGAPAFGGRSSRNMAGENLLGLTSMNPRRQIVAPRVYGAFKGHSASAAGRPPMCGSPDEAVYWGKEGRFGSRILVATSATTGRPAARESARRRCRWVSSIVNPNGAERQAGFPLLRPSTIRETFKRMAMNDRGETVLRLIAGGHKLRQGPTVPADMRRLSVRTPEAERPLRRWASLDEQVRHRQRQRRDPPAAREVTWTTTPTKWSKQLLRETCLATNGSLTKSPAGAFSVQSERRPSAHDSGSLLTRRKRHAPEPCWFTDLSLRLDPAYEKISRRFYAHPDEFRGRVCPCVVQAYPPRHGARRGNAYLGPGGFPGGEGADLARPPFRRFESQADPTPRTIAGPQGPRSSHPDFPSPSLASTAWGLGRQKLFRVLRSSAAGANGARRHPSQPAEGLGRSNQPAQLKKVARNPRRHSEGVQQYGKRRAKKVSLADLICASAGSGRQSSKPPKRGGHDVTVPFAPGPHRRLGKKQTDVESVAYLEPFADGFSATTSRPSSAYRPEEASRRQGANLLTLDGRRDDGSRLAAQCASWVRTTGKVPSTAVLNKASGRR